MYFPFSITGFPSSFKYQGNFAIIFLVLKCQRSKNETLTMCIKNSLIKFFNYSERLCMGYFSYTKPLANIQKYLYKTIKNIFVF